MSAVPRCSVCDAALDAYGRDGTRCARCNEPCPTCGGVKGFCAHPLDAQLTQTHGDPLLPKEWAA